MKLLPTPGRRAVLRLLASMVAAGYVPEAAAAATGPGGTPGFVIEAAKRSAWLNVWQQHILAEARARYCDSAMGEEIGWLISPLLEGFYFGYLITADDSWLDLLVDWADAWIRRGVAEPDGHVGWPKLGAAGTDVDDLNSYYADSMLGEAMVLRPIVLAASTILANATLTGTYGRRAHAYLRLARETFRKWDERGAWRATAGGMISVVLPYGIDAASGKWATEPPDKTNRRVGFSHPCNKANLVAQWMLAMADATGEDIYRERAAAWFRVMRSRLRPHADGTLQIWNYWEPAGEWDYRYFFRPKHWVGVHPNAGYYELDVRAMIAAYQHETVFGSDDVQVLARTATANARPWAALAPYDNTIRVQFESALNPGTWEAIPLVPWYLAQALGLRGPLLTGR